ncbi:MAG: hypothetical protein NXH75_11610 [Halobacteriovoraceae bacterium]|nr:hypothetical protein [Halobacteriovoraceae bacterium]
MNSWKPLIPFILFFLIVAPFKMGKESFSGISFGKRKPAQVENQCYETMREAMVMSNKKSRYSIWRRFIGFPENRFDRDKYKELIKVYTNSAEDPTTIVEESPEGLLALGRALVLRNAGEGRDLIPERALRLNRFKEAHLEEVVSRLKNKGKLEASQIEDLTRELYLTAFGPEFKLRNTFSGKKAREEVLLRIVEEDLLDKGLLRVFKDYRISKSKPSFIQKFNSSPYGRGALAGVLNLPVLIGWPPLYLPGFKPLRLSDELTDEILQKGLTPEVMRRIDMDFTSSAVDKARYEIIRRYYLKGIIVYVSLAGLYDFYQLNKELDQENEILVEAGEQAGEILELTSKLEAQGVDVFSDSNLETGKTFCDAIRACLISIEIDPNEVGMDDPNFKACQSVTDPDSRCKTW